MLEIIKKDLWSLGKQEVLNEIYPFGDGYELALSATKSSVRSCDVYHHNRHLFTRGSLWDTTQTKILEYIADVLEQVEVRAC